MISKFLHVETLGTHTAMGSSVPNRYVLNLLNAFILAQSAASLQYELPPVLRGGESQAIVDANVTSNTTCLRNTGGTCSDQKCEDWRGGTQCDYARCVCQSGYCSGADGRCYHEGNSQVGTTFKLRNARWPDHYMYVSRLNHKIWVGKSTNGQSYFNLFAFAGHKDDSEEVLLGSKEYPRKAAVVAERTNCRQTEQGQACVHQYRVEQVEIDNLLENSVDMLSMHLVAAPPYPGAPKNEQSVMIESFTHPNHFMYIGRLSWTVRAWTGDPGTGGYWIVEPALPLHLREFTGERCKKDCGSYGSGWARG